MLKDLMHAIFNEDVEEDDEEEVVEEPAKQEEVTPEPVVAEPQVQEEEVVKSEPILKEAASSIETDSENFMNSPIFEKAIIQPKPKKTTIFQGLDVDSIAQEEAKPKQKVYKYDRHKSVKVRRVAEDLDYQPVISPIFGNVEDSEKEFDKVHDAITLNKPEDEDFSKILSPMYGTYLPSMQPADSIPEYKVEESKKNMNLSENNINIKEYMLYGDVETKSEKCLVDEGDEVVLTEFPVPEFKNCTLMKKGDEGFYEYKDYRQGENAELAGGYAVSGILQQNKRFDFNYVNDQINGIVQDPFYKVETMGDYQIPMRVLDAYNDLYMAALATTEYIYYLHDSDDVLMVGLENRQTIARGEFAMDSYQESFENIYYGNSYEEEIWMDAYEKDAKTQELESNEMEL